MDSGFGGQSETKEKPKRRIWLSHWARPEVEDMMAE